MNYIDQSASSLLLSVGTDINLSDLNIIKKDFKEIRLKREDNTTLHLIIEYAIIGASHYIHIYNKKSKKTLFKEVFACIDFNDNSSIKIINNQDYWNYYQVSEKEDNNIIYEIKSITSDLDSSIKKEYDRFVSYNTLGYIFPESNEIQSYFKPRTDIIINTDIEKEKILIEYQTMHCYPNENKVVITQSNIIIE